MLKIVGSICVVGTTTLLGIQKGSAIRSTCEELQYLQRLLYQMQSEIRYLRAPLGDLVRRLGRDCREPYRKWLLSLGEDMEERNGKPFSKIWEQGIRIHLRSLHLPEREIERLCALGGQMGAADMELQMRTLGLYQEQLSQTMEELRESMNSKVKLCHCMGIISCIFLVSLLW